MFEGTESANIVPPKTAKNPRNPSKSFILKRIVDTSDLFQGNLAAFVCARQSFRKHLSVRSVSLLGETLQICGRKKPLIFAHLVDAGLDFRVAHTVN
jgi:hypothetical protein